MKRRLVLGFFLGLACGPALAQDVPPPPAAPPPPAVVEVRVTMLTSEGAIVLAVDKTHAPITATNFLRYVDQKRLDGTTIYRALKFGDDGGLIQGGTRDNPKRVLPPIAHEPTTKTGLSHVAGTISMARFNPGSANGDFFILASDIPQLDADPTQPGDNVGYAAFGHVVEGMDVVKRIVALPTSPTAGEGAMRGQMLAAPVKIISVRRSD